MKTIAVILFAMVLLLLYAMQMPVEEPKQLNLKQIRLERGEMLVMSYCALCHGSDNGKLAGKRMTDLTNVYGNIHASNITRDKKNGIGNYTREQLRILLRTRVKQNGQKALVVMPAFPLMADEDIEAILDFLLSDHYAVQPSAQTYPPQVPNPKYKKLDQKMPVFDFPQRPIPLPDPNNQLALGSYYVNAVFRCFDCHSGDEIPLDLDPVSSKHYLSGGKVSYDLDQRKVKVPNITPDAETGIGLWSRDDLTRLLTQGILKNGLPARYPMLPFPALGEKEIASIYTYLRSVKPIHHTVK